MPKIDSNKNEYKNYCLKFLQIQEFLAKEINDQHRYTLLAFNYNIIYNKLLRLGEHTDYLQKSYDIWCMLDKKYPNDSLIISQKKDTQKRLSNNQ